ncbi:MAG: hypothetical protein KAJ40_08870 [Alphaproteobacteria bacterium]|nr:hypothetical protein [Alphaproteobacteria bacterium]
MLLTTKTKPDPGWRRKKSSKAQIHAKFHKIPAIRFEDQKLTSFSGLLIFQALFMKTNRERFAQPDLRRS